MFRETLVFSRNNRRISSLLLAPLQTVTFHKAPSKAVRAGPHNIDAWTTAWYVANNMLKDRALARRIIDEAKAKNPDSLEIAFAEARFVYDGGKGDAASAERLLERALESASRRCGGRLSGLSERDAETCSRMREYLCGVRKARVGRP